MEAIPIIYRNGKPYSQEQAIVPLDDFAEYLRLFSPGSLNSLSVEEICAIDRGNMERAAEIIQEHGLADDVSSVISRELSNHEIYVVETEAYREGNDMIIDFYCLPPEDSI